MNAWIFKVSQESTICFFLSKREEKNYLWLLFSSQREADGLFPVYNLWFQWIADCNWCFQVQLCFVAFSPRHFNCSDSTSIRVRLGTLLIACIGQKLYCRVLYQVFKQSIRKKKEERERERRKTSKQTNEKTIHTSIAFFTLVSTFCIRLSCLIVCISLPF